jgi:G3E family GTPase
MRRIARRAAPTRKANVPHQTASIKLGKTLMRVTLLYGFLGAGKTTLLSRLLDACLPDEKLAVIVNEFGAVGVDAAILEGRAVDTVELASGCICCSLKGELVDAIAELVENVSPDRLIIEASGVALPGDIRAALATANVSLGPAVTVVDVARFRQMRTALGLFYTDQIADAGIVLVNKIDLVDSAECAAVHDDIVALAPDATIAFTEACDIDLDFIFDAPAQKEGAAPHHGARHHISADSLVLDAPGPLAEDRVRRFFRDLPSTVWRAKGFLLIDGATLLVQHVPGQTELSPMPPRDHHYLVYVGQDLDKAELEATLKNCADGDY